jgi:hypothetical protein
LRKSGAHNCQVSLIERPQPPAAAAAAATSIAQHAYEYCYWINEQFLGSVAHWLALQG